MRIGLATDEITYDEILLYNVSEGLGVKMGFIDLKSLLLSGDVYEEIVKEHDLAVVVNRAVSKNLRERSAEIFERAGLKVLNPYIVEYVSNDKLRTKEAFRRFNLETVRYVLFPDFPFSRRKEDGRLRFYREKAKTIAKTIAHEVGFPAVIKPIGGSRGKSIRLIKDENDFLEECFRCYKLYIDGWSERRIPEALRQCVSNPIGIFAEEFIPHSLDLRVIVGMRRGESPQYIGCLGRVGRGEEEIAKNTALGSIPIGIDLPEEYRRIATDCIRAIVNYVKSFGYSVDYCLVGVDIIPRCDNPLERRRVYEAARRISPFKDKYIEQVKAQLSKAIRKLASRHGRNLDAYVKDKDFKDVDKNLVEVFRKYREMEEYKNLVKTSEEYLDVSEPKPNEVNTRVDYGINTRNAACLNIPYHIIQVISSTLGYL